MDHKLINALAAFEPSDDEMQELYQDLKFIFENPFDDAINAALARRCAYIEPQMAMVH